MFRREQKTEASRKEGGDDNSGKKRMVLEGVTVVEMGWTGCGRD